MHFSSLFPSQPTDIRIREQLMQKAAEGVPDCPNPQTPILTTRTGLRRFILGLGVPTEYNRRDRARMFLGRLVASVFPCSCNIQYSLIVTVRLQRYR